jgi:hypothetical protein
MRKRPTVYRRRRPRNPDGPLTLLWAWLRAALSNHQRSKRDRLTGPCVIPLDLDGGGQDRSGVGHGWDGGGQDLNGGGQDLNGVGQHRSGVGQD